MNTKPQNESSPYDAHNAALDLGGLEGLLDRGHVEIVDQKEGSEHALILRLLNQLCLVNELVEDTQERLTAANERLTSLASLVTIQNKQVELLTHYQAQAARATALENQLAIIKLENQRLKQPWWRKLMLLLK